MNNISLVCALKFSVKGLLKVFSISLTVKNNETHADGERHGHADHWVIIIYLTYGHEMLKMKTLV